MKREETFKDILKPRNTHFGIVKFMTRSWSPRKCISNGLNYSSEEIKNAVSKSVFLDSIIEAESAKSGVCKEQLKKEIATYLDEIALDKKMHVVRWMGVFFLKMAFMMKIGIFVNEASVLKLRETLGENPVLFLPTHRSYADFCLMTYLCYHYDIELPAVAAGMDFYSMAVVGQSMRETGAFYIRRSLAGAHLYASTLRQYIHELVSKYTLPVEFFVEGTRSRSNKSLPPKYGILTMTLTPYFTREVDDITIVPVNISYDRLMEQGLFAYEHLGVPKPKETTGGLLKALRSLNDHFGNVYISVGEPLSLKKFIGRPEFSTELSKPSAFQQLTDAQLKSVQNVAHQAVLMQQENTVVTISNLLSIVLMGSLYKNKLLDFEEVLVEMGWVIKVLRTLGASVFENDVRSSVERVLVVHRSMVTLDKDKKLRLVSSALREVDSGVQMNMKGHILKAQTMVSAVPIVQLQLYVNPVLHYLVPPAILYLIVRRGSIEKGELQSTYKDIRRMLSNEFYHLQENEDRTFNKALEYCTQNQVVVASGTTFSDGTDQRLQDLLQWAVVPALTTLLTCADVMIEYEQCEHKRAVKRVQELVEERGLHPYCLSLEAAGNCLQGLVMAGAAARRKIANDVLYEAVPDKLRAYRQLVQSVLPDMNIVLASSAVILQHCEKSRL
ncbi:dihydroxyacetone phosphate acyltransferase isoform X2 [Leptidea sinapis]|uniref:dihydroxyacetone phosphate acyltransferase isoform X2 n=1 Tax=Leptidea sinapis TaxID=189913 RepID=UPI0021C272E9|nr:dihydroxyacetone phosphate acyltransferase isoform X2 [Leptidea sinapis]